jgi:hypothetical protein
MVQLSATRCSCIAILWVSLASFSAITLYVASQRVFIFVSIYFFIGSVRKLLDTASYSEDLMVKTGHRDSYCSAIRICWSTSCSRTSICHAISKYCSLSLLRRLFSGCILNYRRVGAVRGREDVRTGFKIMTLQNYERGIALTVTLIGLF